MKPFKSSPRVRQLASIVDKICSQLEHRTSRTIEHTMSAGNNYILDISLCTISTVAVSKDPPVCGSELSTEGSHQVTAAPTFTNTSGSKQRRAVAWRKSVSLDLLESEPPEECSSSEDSKRKGKVLIGTIKRKSSRIFRSIEEELHIKKGVGMFCDSVIQKLFLNY